MTDKIIISDTSTSTMDKVKTKIDLYSGKLFEELSKEEKDELLKVLLIQHGYLKSDDTLQMPKRTIERIPEKGVKL